jgi:precorrin-2 dehydrogenase/sirohydrochlorin ferrochelatase
VPNAYPLLLDVTQRLVVIIGGGAVAARKAAGVQSAGGKRIRCVALEFHVEIPLQVERIADAYKPEHLDGAALVFAATGQPAVNAAVVRDCRALGILVNRADADDLEPGDFITPAKFAEGAVIVTVSAGSPALSAALRDSIAQSVDRRYIRMADAMQELRPIVRGTPGLTQGRRAEIFRALAGAEALAELEAGGTKALRSWLLRSFVELTHA